MTIAQEMFRFVSVRRPERAIRWRMQSRLIRDRRELSPNALLPRLFGPGSYESKLHIAQAYAVTSEFLAEDDLAFLAIEPAASYFRDALARGALLSDLATGFEKQLPQLSALLAAAPHAQLLESVRLMNARLWNSLYARTILACDRYVSTNYLIDGLRIYHVLRLLWLAKRAAMERWAGGGFDEYEPLIDLQAAFAAAGDSKQLVAEPDRRTLQDHALDPPIVASQSLSAPAQKAIATASLQNLTSSTTFRVPLSVGTIKPPVVGDLIVVKQELRRYEQGELAACESIMHGERRERTIRKLNRTSQTTTIDSSLEQEESSSVKTDERFQLSSQAQNAASENFGVQAGVNVTGKFGPVQIGVSVNASYDNSKSSSEASSQEYAKTVTEEATNRIKTSIKETSSITILTEEQDTSLHSFNNENGTTHVNGLYRWIDKVYEAQLLNYGRRMMLSIDVPEPASFYHALLERNEEKALSRLIEPVHPSRIDVNSFQPLSGNNVTTGFDSYHKIGEGNYARLAALYDVSVQPPPPEYLTGSKAIVYPEASPAAALNEHNHSSDPSWVMADNSWTLDPSYHLTAVAVFAPEGADGQFGSYANALKVGEDGSKVKDANLLLVQVGSKSFYMSVRKHPDDNDLKLISTNFNVWQPIEDDSHSYGELVQPSIPITITANFEGILSLVIVYKAYRLQEAYDAWKSTTYAAIIKGYNAKKQAYDQALTLAQAKAQAGTTEKTLQLRDDQYRSIELTELKRGCIEILSRGTAAGHTSIAFTSDGMPRIVDDPSVGEQFGNWRSPLANGTVAELFELGLDWENTTYNFLPYYWAGERRWKKLAQATAGDPVFEQFLRAGSASVIVPVRPRYERTMIFFLKTGLVWGGGKMPLFSAPDMLDIYADVELGSQLEPAEALGEPWEIRVPTSMVMLQEGDLLPVFEPEADSDETRQEAEPVPDESVPF